MIFKLLLLPFRIVFWLLRAIFYPWYLRWVFRLPWFIYAAMAVWIGTLVYAEYEDYLVERLQADIQIREGLPAPAPLSTWNDSTATGYGELNVQALYFTALPQATFQPMGLERTFIALADELGREVKAVLVVRPSELTRLRNQLAGQGSGDRIDVTVNGTLNRDGAWREMIRRQIDVMNLPASDNLVVIEPFLGSRVDAINDTGMDSRDTAVGLGILAVLFALGAALKMMNGMPSARPKATQNRAATQAATTPMQKSPTQKALPNGAQSPAPSPWARFQDDKFQEAAFAQTPPKSALNKQPKQARAKPPVSTPPPEPPFVSVFPGGGSSFRFKTADQIIRQSFGTLSALKSAKQDD